jgi:hypothetical protein
MRLIGKGLNADVFDNGDGTVVKLYRPDMPESLYLQDYQVSKAVSKHYKNMPTVHGLKELTPYPGLILEKIDGLNLVEALSKDPLRIEMFAKEFAKTHFDLHRYSIEELPRQKDVLIADIRKANLPTEDIEDLIAHTRALPDGDRLCHNDFMPTNVIYSDRGMVVIDWRTATQGNNLADVARTVLLHEVPREDIGITASMDIVRQIFKSIYLREYLKLAQVAKSVFTSWMLPLSVIRLGEGVSEREKRILLRRINGGLKGLRRSD